MPKLLYDNALFPFCSLSIPRVMTASESTLLHKVQENLRVNYAALLFVPQVTFHTEPAVTNTITRVN